MNDNLTTFFWLGRSWRRPLVHPFSWAEYDVTALLSTARRDPSFQIAVSLFLTPPSSLPLFFSYLRQAA